MLSPSLLCTLILMVKCAGSKAMHAASTSASASACKMLGQVLKSWNFSLSVFCLAF